MGQEVKINLPNGKEHLSPSSSKHLANHPQSFISYMEGKFEPNDAMIFGIYYEDVVYNNPTEDRFYILDDKALVHRATKEYGKETKSIRNTKVYKDIYADAIAKAGDRYVITEAQHDKAISMANIMHDSGVFDKYLQGDTQVTKEGVVDTGLYVVDKVLVRSDAVLSNGIATDLKTTSSTIRGWNYQAKNLGYDIQAYLSMEVWGTDSFPFIVQRTEGLYDIGVFTAERDGWLYESGKRKFNKAIENYLSYIDEDAVKIGANPMLYVEYQTI